MRKLELLIAGVIFLMVGNAIAGDSYDNCTGFIDSLPVSISTQGNWCLRKDLSTNISTGAAITIATNNVTVDCKGYKLGGLAAGVGTQAMGVQSSGRLNSTVKQCNIRGFFSGVSFTGGGGHVVEDNRFDGNTRNGLRIDGDGSVARRNMIVATGGSTDSTYGGIAEGIFVSDGDVDVIDNAISGVVPAEHSVFGGSSTVGIEYNGGAGVLSGNRIRGLAPAPGAPSGAAVVGIQAWGRVLVSNNHIVGSGGNGFVYGVECQSLSGVVRDNTLSGFSQAHTGCTNGNGNVLSP